MGNLAGNTTYSWTNNDYLVSNTMEDYFANFIKTFNPNGAGLQQWPAMKNNNEVMYMNIDLKPSAQRLNNIERYNFLDRQQSK